MLFAQDNFDIQHHGNITTLRAWSAARKVGKLATDVETPAPPSTEAQFRIRDAKMQRILFVLAAIGLGLACLAILLALPFGLFPGEVFESVVAAVFGLLLALGPGGLVAGTLIRGPVGEIRIDRATGRVDVVERDILDGAVRAKTAQCENVTIETVRLSDADFVVIGTRAFMGFQLWIKPASGNRTAADLTRELHVSLGRNENGGRPFMPHRMAASMAAARSS